MKYVGTEDNRLYNCDCMDYMKTLPDKSIDLCIVDPPYNLERFKNGIRQGDRLYRNAGGKYWNNNYPEKLYFDELFRVSKNQIIWGANNFILPPTEYFLIWNKMQTVKNFSSAEYAWCSMGLKQPALVFDYSIHRNNQKDKIHPTQKPEELYIFCLENYAKPGYKLLDTHSGSGSFRIAAHDLGFSLDSCELDADYCRDNEARFQKHISQPDLFGTDEYQKIIYKEQELF